MHIKKGDMVKIRSGRDRRKTGKVIRVIPERDLVTVEGANLLIKHLRARRGGEKGQRVQFPAPLPVSRVSLLCPKCNRTTRVGVRLLEDGTKQRECKKCRQTFT